MNHIHILLDLELYIKTTKFKTLKYIWHRYTMANTHLFRQGQGMRFCILFLFFCSFLLIPSTFSKRTFHGFDYKLAITIIITFLQYSVHFGWTMFNFINVFQFLKMLFFLSKSWQCNLFINIWQITSPTAQRYILPYTGVWRNQTWLPLVRASMDTLERFK